MLVLTAFIEVLPKDREAPLRPGRRHRLDAHGGRLRGVRLLRGHPAARTLRLHRALARPGGPRSPSRDAPHGDMDEGRRAEADLRARLPLPGGVDDRAEADVIAARISNPDAGFRAFAFRSWGARAAQ